MTEQKKKQIKESAKQTVKAWSVDWLLIALSIEAGLNYLFDYWTLISPYLGEHEGLIRIPAFILRMLVIGIRVYSNGQADNGLR